MELLEFRSRGSIGTKDSRAGTKGRSSYERLAVAQAENQGKKPRFAGQLCY